SPPRRASPRRRRPSAWVPPPSPRAPGAAVDQTEGYAARVTGSTIHNFWSYLKATRLRGLPLRPTARGSRTDRLSRRALLLAGLTLGATAGGASPQHRDPQATLAAHREHARLMFDRLLGTGAAELARGWLRWPLRLRTGGRTVAALRSLGPGAVELEPAPAATRRRPVVWNRAGMMGPST